jgi:hypothetical protein
VFRPAQIFATWILAIVLTGTWVTVIWLFLFAPAVIAIAGFVYAIAALFMFLEFRAADAQTKFEKDAQDIRREISAGGVRGFTFLLARPLFHFALLPSRSLSGALALAAVLAVPWLIVR